MPDLLPWLATCLLTRSVRPWVLADDPVARLDLTARNLGIYVHVPFCRTLCSFCPYCKTLFDADTARKFAAALSMEIRLAAGGESPRPDATSLYLGGGTPALLAPRLQEIAGVIREAFHLTGSTGMELHPDDLEPGVLDAALSAGVDMVSIGVQSFQPHCLRALGRAPLNPNRVRAAIAGRPFHTVDVDLIFGLPGQSDEDLAADLTTAVECGATQVSTYPFIPFTFCQNSRKMPGAGERRRRLERLVRQSRALGMERTSVWTFAQKGTRKYSSITRENYVGFGPSAVSLTGGSFRVNTFSVDAYIDRLCGGRLPVALSLTMNARRRALYWLFWSSYGLWLDRAGFRELFGQGLEDVFGIELAVALRLGLVRRASGGYSLTDSGAYAFHLVEQAYTRQYIDKTWRQARSLAWPHRIVLR